VAKFCVLKCAITRVFSRRNGVKFSKQPVSGVKLNSSELSETRICPLYSLKVAYGFLNPNHQYVGLLLCFQNSWKDGCYFAQLRILSL